jgi:autotransporter-associated beta strand protein
MSHGQQSHRPDGHPLSWPRHRGEDVSGPVFVGHPFAEELRLGMSPVHDTAKMRHLRVQPARWVILVAAACLAFMPLHVHAQALSPLGYWQYSGNASSSGTDTRNVVTNTGSVTFTQAGVVGTAAAFNGSSQFLRLNVSIGAAGAPSGGYALGQNFTMATWYFVTAQTTLRQYVWESATAYDLSAGGSSPTATSLTVYGSESPDQTLSVPNGLAIGTWHHLVQVYQLSGGSSTMTAYYNGNLIGSTPAVAQTAINASSIALGAYRSGTSTPRLLNGLLDETAAWNRSLSAGDAMEAYLRGLQGQTLTAATSAINSWNPSGTNTWTTAGNWTNSLAVGVTGDAASTDTGTAIFKSYSLSNGLGIDMSAGAANGSLALGAIVVNSSSGTLQIGNSSTTADGVLRLNGNTTSAGANTVIDVSGASNLVIANAPSGTGTRTLGVTLGVTNGTVSVGTGRTATISSTIGEATAGSAITKAGAGTLILSGANNFSGGVTLSAGEVRIGNDSALGSGPVIVSGGTLESDGSSARELANSLTFSGAATLGDATNTGPLTFTGPVNLGGGLPRQLTVTSDVTLAGTVSNGGIRKSGAGVLTLGAANTYTGQTFLEAGTLSIADVAALGPNSDNAARINFTGSGTLRYTGSGPQSLTKEVWMDVANSTATIDVSSPAGTLTIAPSAGTRSRPFTKLGSGILAFNGAFSGSATVTASEGTLILGSNNSHSGQTTIDGGATLQLGAGGTTGTLGSGPVANAGTFIIDRSNAVTIAQTISGTGGLVHRGGGTTTLGTSNSYGGGTIISAGTLVAANASALGTGTATVASGARLRLDPGSIIANPIANLGTGSFLGAVDFAGGGLARTSTAGGTTFGTLLAGSSGAAASLNPAISWLSQTGATASDIMRLTNTSGTAQVLSLTYDPLLAPAAPQEAYLGWFDTATSDWVNAIDGNTAGTGSFFNGSWTAYLAANPTATPSTAIGAYGHDSATNSVWAVVNHNSDFAVIVVPEPGTLALAGLGLAAAAAFIRRRRLSA